MTAPRGRTDAASVPAVIADLSEAPRTMSSMKLAAQTPDGDRLAGYVKAFLSGIRSAAAEPGHFGWTQAYTAHTLGLCERTEQLGGPAAWLVVELCCAGRNPLRFEDALATVEAVLRPPETS